MAQIKNYRRLAAEAPGSPILAGLLAGLAHVLHAEESAVKQALWDANPTIRYQDEQPGQIAFSHGLLRFAQELRNHI
jgi:hypothetical protein